MSMLIIYTSHNFLKVQHPIQISYNIYECIECVDIYAIKITRIDILFV